ncbi:calcium-activated chloride channel regulator 3A-1-like [Littorina saxatilis]|uniref:VWFA domain-containing protein n=1 Tax=Littorina saxatilis TaxID=31220 RepID=A0AAN9B277_9CAEN
MALRYPAMTLTVIVAVITLPALVGACGRGTVFLRDNGYQRLLVAIDDEVGEDARLVQRIKDVFVNASRLLFQMSRQRAYFEDVHILIPDSWSDQAEHLAPTWQQVDKSDVTVGPVPADQAGQGAGDAPFTVRTTPCGELGLFIHLTPQYLLNDTLAAQSGPYDKVFLHEWSHLRFGVFDEYNEDDEIDFYAATNGELEGVRCPALLTGEMLDTVSQSRFCRFVDGQPDANCRFLPDIDSLPQGSGSIMFFTESNQVSEWCDDDVDKLKTLHNRQAPSEHNKQCAGRSVWQVLRNHGDFRDGQNPASNLTTPPATHFTLVKRRSQRTVLVLDMSGSMRDNDRIVRLGQAASNYLLTVARQGEAVGIVWFQETASIQVNLTQINNVTRRQLLQHVPKVAVGGTGIGDGLLKGLDVLEWGGGGTSGGGGTIILLSDGIQTHPPWVKDVVSQVRQNNVRVHTIAVSGEADKSLELVAQETGGLSFYYSDTNPSNTLNEAFLAMADAGVPWKQQQQQLASETAVLGAGERGATAFVIDPTASDDVTVAIAYTDDSAPVITMTSPSGRLITSVSPEYEVETSFKTIYISLGQMVETGEYQVNLTNPATREQNMYVTATARMTQGEEAPVVVRSQWRHQTVNFTATQQALYVSVSKGYAPVINTDVVATVENPPLTSSDNATSSVMSLLDNGAGSDVKKDDGIYSSYVTTFTANGRYNVHVLVRDVTGTVVADGVVGVGVPPSAARRRRSGYQRKSAPVESFQRISSPGSFTLQNYDASLGDMIPPSRISDLQVRRVGATSVELEWTAPGDNLDQGTAAGYVLKMTRDFEVLFSNHSQVVDVSDQQIMAGSLHSPLASGSRESITVYVSGGAATFYFAIQAYDNTSNISPPSNIVSATTAFAAQETSPFDPLVLTIVVSIAAGILIVGVVGILLHRRRSGSKNIERRRTKVMHPNF